MKTMRVYLETSLFGFWYDVHQRNRKNRRHVRRLLLSCRKGKGIHRGYVSAVVFAELEESREPYKSRDLGLLGKIDPEPVTARHAVTSGRCVCLLECRSAKGIP